MALDVIANDGPLSIRAKYTVQTADRGVTVGFYDTTGGIEVEVLTFDLFERVPHWHPNREEGNAGASARRVPDLDAKGLIKHLLEVETLPGLARRAAELRPNNLAQHLEGDEVKGLVYSMVDYVSRQSLRSS